MATVYTRAGKGSALTWTEGDANITNLNTDKIEAVADDATPALGGDLDVLTNEIKTTTTNGSIVLRANGTGVIEAISDGFVVGNGTAGAAITSNGAFDLSLVTNDGTNSGSITITAGANGNIDIAPDGTGKLVLDNGVVATPTTVGIDIASDTSAAVSWTADGEPYNSTLGAYSNLYMIDSGIYFETYDATTGYQHNFDTTNGKFYTAVGVASTSALSIESGTDSDLTLTAAGTGKVVIDGINWPTADGTANQLLKTDGSGNLSFTTITSGIADVVADTTPQLGGNLDINGQQIVSVSNGNIVIAPNGTGQTLVKNIEYNENIFSLGTTSGTITPDAANGNVQTITLNGNLTFNAFSSPIAGQSITLIVNTNGTSRTLTSTMKFSGGTKTISTTSTTDIISVFYDGTNYWASLSTDFK